MGVHGVDTSLLVFEAATGRCIRPKWTKQAAAIVQRAGMDTDDTFNPFRQRKLLFSSDGSMLLCVQRCGTLPHESSLHILHIQGGNIAAASPLSTVCHRGLARYDYGHGLDGRILWHPNSHGVVVPGCTLQLADDHHQPFQRAGLAIGHCPFPAYLGKSSAFSPTGELLLAAGPDVDTETEQALHKVPWVIMQVAQQGHTYAFSVLHLLEDAGCSSLRGAWVPGGLRGHERLLLDSGRGLKWLTPQGQLLGSIVLHGCRLPWSKRFQKQPYVSVCGQFRPIIMDRDSFAACVLHCPSEKVFEAASSAARFEGQVQNLMWPACGSCMVLSSGSSSGPHIQEPPFTVLTFT